MYIHIYIYIYIYDILFTNMNIFNDVNGGRNILQLKRILFMSSDKNITTMKVTSRRMRY